MKHIYIYAGSHRQAEQFAKEKRLHPQNWTFLYNTEQLRGIRGMYFVKCGTWFDHPKRRDIDNMLIEREMKEISDIDIMNSTRGE